MRLVRWILTWELATVGWATGRPTMHAYVPGSSTPLCMPPTKGDPPTGIGETGGCAYCSACRQSSQTAYWAWVPISKRIPGLAWHVTTGYPLERTARGTAADEVAALKQCIAALDRLVGDVPVEGHRGSAHGAEALARELRADARAERPSNGSDVQLTEYAYRHERRLVWGPTLGLVVGHEWHTSKAKIIKRTARRIFIEAETRTTDKGNTVLRTYSFDRATLESGQKTRYGWSLDPNPPYDPSSGAPSVPAWAVALELEMPTTLAKAKRAFRRLAKVHHPDHGGDPAAFGRVREAFDAAQQHFGGAT